MTPRESIMQIIANAWDEEVSGGPMSDIGKCRGVIELKMCPRRNECRRFTEPSRSYWQAWISPKEPCDMFLTNKEYRK